MICLNLQRGIGAKYLLFSHALFSRHSNKSQECGLWKGEDVPLCRPPSHTLGHFADRLHYSWHFNKTLIIRRYQKAVRSSSGWLILLTLLLDLQNEDKEVVRLAQWLHFCILWMPSSHKVHKRQFKGMERKSGKSIVETDLNKHPRGTPNGSARAKSECNLIKKSLF